MLTTFIVATVLIALAELGDKTQLLALFLATRFRAWEVLVGILAATLIIHLGSTAVGGIVGSLIPQFWLAIVTGVLFVGFGIWTLRGDKEDDEAAESLRYGPILTSGIAFFLAELGDKTQLMTMGVAADPAAALRLLSATGLKLSFLSTAPATPAGTFLGVWLGSTAGMMIADGLAIAVGCTLGRKLPQHVISRVAGAFFILFGVGAFVTAFLGRG